jgi:CBS domain-containing protein
MITREKPLLSLTASDLMTQPVVTIPESMTLQAAGRLLAREHFSGVPVVDALGKCVGMLSATDFLGFWVRHQGHGDEQVSRYMIPDPVMVPPNTPIARLARMMIDAHIHRVVVVDDDMRPVGLVSSTDVLAAVTYSGDRSAS